MKLSIDCVLQAPVDEAMLATLGRKVFEENGGNGFPPRRMPLFQLQELHDGIQISG